MAEITREAPYIGRANMVLLFGQRDEPTAVISSVVVRVCAEVRGGRLRFLGPAAFDKKTAKHIADVVLPTADSILEALDLAQENFDISVVNIGAASINDIGLNISKFSADVPVLLAILSAVLEIPVPQDTVCTGHIASADGDIRMVTGIAAKLKAAIDTESISTFVHPALDQDSSMDSLSPMEKERAAAALSKAKGGIRAVSVRDVEEVLKAVFSDDRVVLSSLRKGFYKLSMSRFAQETPIGRAAQYLARKNAKRLWAALECQLLRGQNDDAEELLVALALFHIDRKIYPKALGYRLLKLVQSLPPQTRRLKIAFPLLPISQCIKLSQFAQESEHEDVLLLFKATSGQIARQSLRTAEGPGPTGGTELEGDSERARMVLSEIDRDALTSISIPIDLARATYGIDSVTINSYDEFIDTITSFHVHLMRYNRSVSEPLDLHDAGAEAFALLERAFATKGGFQGALSEATNAINGGLRLVLDVITEQFKREEQEKQVNQVLKSALDPLDWKGKVALIKAFLKRLEPHLPPEIISQPPERFAGHYEIIARGYVQSMDQVKTLFRSL
jgi:hypothetical protein